MRVELGITLFLAWTVSVQGQTYLVDGGVQTLALSATNGNKVAAGRFGRLHAAYARNGSIYYASSTNGRTWSAPLLIATSGATPAVAAMTDGTVGVAFYEGGSTRYTWCKNTANAPCAVWNGPYFAVNGSQPSLVAYQSKMHLATAVGGIVLYTSFAPLLIADQPYGSWERAFYDPGVCLNQAVFFPAVTVRPDSTLGTEVRVSFLNTAYDSGNCGQMGNRMVINGAVRSPWGGWNPTWGHSVQVINPTAQPVSLSAATNAATGEVYVAASYFADGNYTTLHRRAADGTWWTYQLTATKTWIDIESDGSPCSPGIRIAYSDVTTGATAYLTGNWKGIAAQPTFGAAVSVLPAGGRDPQAMFWSAAVNMLTRYEMPAIFTRDTGSGNAHVEAYSVNTGPQSACPVTLAQF